MEPFQPLLIYFCVIIYSYVINDNVIVKCFIFFDPDNYIFIKTKKNVGYNF